MKTNNLRDLPLWWVVGIPAAMLLLTFYAFFTSQELMSLMIRRDDDPLGPGIAENGTALILLSLWYRIRQCPVTA